jgi:large subunit ribosomal protein L3
MTRVFTEDGVSTPVTVIEATPNRVTQVRTSDVDGYEAVQVTAGTKKAGTGLWEFRVNGVDEYQPGSELTVEMFEAGQKVDATGVTIGKGFAGAIKRHHFRSQDMTHGNSLSHRAPGSIGQNQTPGRVFKGKKMAGHLGNKQRTIQNLEVVRVDTERHLLLIKGAVPGAKGGDVIIRPAIKSLGQ